MFAYAKPVVLIVGDSAEMNRFIADSLVEDCTVEIAVNETEALKKALTVNPALVIADSRLSVADWFDWAGKLHIYPELSGVPIVLLTEKLNAAVKMKLLEQDVQDYLDIPFSSRELQIRVNNLISAKRANARYRTLFNSMDQGFCTVEVLFDQQDKPVDYRFLEVNQAFEKQTGITNAVGKRMRELAPDHEQHWFDIYGKIALTGESARFENSAQALGRWYEVYAFRIGRRENRQVAIFFNDITERKHIEAEILQTSQGLQLALSAGKQAAEALRLSEEKFRASFHQAAVGMCIVGLDGRFELVNERLSEMLGYRNDEFETMSARELTFPDDYSATETQFHRLLAGEIGEYALEKRYCHKKGHAIWCRATVSLLRDKRGQPEKLIGVIEDISQRRQVEDDLRTSREELRVLSNSVPQLVWMTDPDGHIFWYNDRWFEYTGTNLEQMKGWGWETVHHPDHLPRILSKWRDALSSGQDWEDTFPLRGADGQYRWFLSRAFPLRDAQGKITRWFGSNTDIEDVRRNQEALHQAHAELEQRVAERTAKLSETVAQMEEFSYAVSHDLRAPLRAMRAYSKVLLEDNAEMLAAIPNALDYLRRIEDNAARLDKMALDVLTFSRMARSEMPLVRVCVDKLVREIVQHYPGMSVMQVDIQIAPLSDVMGHEPSLVQIMSNLLSNAIKFAVPGSVPKIRIWSENRDGEIRIWVEDQGIGIDPDYHHRLFKMFERIHPDSGHHGTGVGLALVRKAAERMNGTVGVESRGGAGSRFWVQFKGVPLS